MSRATEQQKALAAEILPTIKREDVKRAYSGKPGCGCGCRGVYRESGRLVTANFAEMSRRLDEVGAQIDDDVVILFLEDETRYRWLYLHRDAVEQRVGHQLKEVA